MRLISDTLKENEREDFIDYALSILEDKDLLETITYNVHYFNLGFIEIRLHEIEKYFFYIIFDKIPDIPITLINSDGSIDNAFVDYEENHLGY